jgi:hypothetical protein
MKSYHLVLLVAGAGLAAGLAYKMTQLPPIAMPASARVAENAPSAPDVAVPKPSPIPQKRRVVPLVNAPVATRASAPETVYTEPPKPVVRETQQPVAPAKPARKPQPVSVATIKPPSTKPQSVKVAIIKPQTVKPKQWIPGKYESTADAKAAVKTPAPQALAKPAPAPLVVASLDKSNAGDKSDTPVVPAIEKDTPALSVPRHQATLQNGMTITIRLDEPLSSNVSRPGATFAGELVDPLIAGGFIIAERGARVSGRVLDSQKAGRFTGISRLVVGLTNVSTSDGQQVAISTDPWMRLGDTLPADTVVRFRLSSTVTITERQLAAK